MANKVKLEFSNDEIKTIRTALKIAIVDCVERGKRAKSKEQKLNMRQKENEFNRLESFFYNVQVGYIK